MHESNLEITNNSDCNKTQWVGVWMKNEWKILSGGSVCGE